jgi:hypothetical protein
MASARATTGAPSLASRMPCNAAVFQRCTVPRFWATATCEGESAKIKQARTYLGLQQFPQVVDDPSIPTALDSWPTSANGSVPVFPPDQLAYFFQLCGAKDIAVQVSMLPPCRSFFRLCTHPTGYARNRGPLAVAGSSAPASATASNT